MHEGFRAHSIGELLRLSHEVGSAVLLDLLTRHSAKVEARVEEQTERAAADLKELAEIEASETAVLLSPQTWNRRRADLGMAIGGDREVNSEEGIAKIGHGIDVGRQCLIGLLGLQIESFEGKDFVVL